MHDIGPPYQFGTVQKIAVAIASAAITNAWGAQTRRIRVACNTDCYVAIGTAPTATTNDHFMPAGAIDYIIVPSAKKLAAIRATADGVLTVTECSR